MAIHRAHCSDATVFPTPGRPPMSTRSCARMPPLNTSSSGSKPVPNRVARGSVAHGATSAMSSAAVAIATVSPPRVITSLTSASEAGLGDADDGRAGHDHEQCGQDAEHDRKDDLDRELHGSLLRLHLPLVAHLSRLDTQHLCDRDA